MIAYRCGCINHADGVTARHGAGAPAPARSCPPVRQAPFMKVSLAQVGRTSGGPLVWQPGPAVQRWACFRFWAVP